MKTVISCPHCDADYEIKHDMDEHFYKTKYCIFCGEEIHDDLIDPDEEDWSDGGIENDQFD